jgi:molybdopterin-guanine dinucleotide biosynthesis protein A
MHPDPPPTSDRLRRVVVLAGGGSTRLGSDKLVADLDGRGVLEALLDGVRAAVPDAEVVVVGPAARASAGALVVSEDPPGGGPVAGLAAGLAAGTGSDDDLVAVLAGDQPFGAAALAVLTAACSGDRSLDGAVGVDAGGRDQPLLAVYRAGPLRRAVGPEPHGARVRDVVARLSLARTPVPASAALDVDTAEDLQQARALAREEGGARRP